MKKDWDKIVREKTNYKTLDEYLLDTLSIRTETAYGNIGMCQSEYWVNLHRLKARRTWKYESPAKEQARKKANKYGYEKIEDYIRAQNGKLLAPEIANNLGVSYGLLRSWVVGFGFSIEGFKKNWDKVVVDLGEGYLGLDDYFNKTKNKQVKEVYSKIGMSGPTFFQHMRRLGIKRRHNSNQIKKNEARNRLKKMGYSGIKSYYNKNYSIKKNIDISKELGISPMLVVSWAKQYKIPLFKDEEKFKNVELDKISKSLGFLDTEDYFINNVNKKISNIGEDLNISYGRAARLSVKYGVEKLVSFGSVKKNNEKINSCDSLFNFYEKGYINDNAVSAQKYMKEIMNDFKKRIEKNKINGSRVADLA